MTVNSMTGFARSIGSFKTYSWQWEAKSVNGKGLEIRCRMPAGFDQLEDKIRKLLKSTFHRGSMNIQLQFENTQGEQAYRVNTVFLDELLTLANQYVEEGRGQLPNMDGMLALKGVIEQNDIAQDHAGNDELQAVLLESAAEVLANLSSVRAEEGGRLSPILNAQLDEIEILVSRAKEQIVDGPDNSRRRLKTQMDRILSETKTLDEGRLEQELALLATKADISEELDRLSSHIASAREVLNGTSDHGMGRRLDFICQEFNREANTLCSKSSDKALTQTGLDMKAVIDRLREQVQNIE
ncbi:YicC family protein [Sneathiella marina]|uniref:YicC family protein n=1 Tax=Sneathiella marina TaxID=2950108 RepID=A0ABY4W284_9PROT|nr:YicC/YloC family endoribonuclease [Sneathiella marina]USG59987.1 YicC family protein [Sneathiella marina]